MPTATSCRPRTAIRRARASSPSHDASTASAPNRAWRWWRQHRSAVIISIAAAVVAGGIVRMMTDQTVVRVVTFDEP